MEGLEAAVEVRLAEPADYAAISRIGKLVFRYETDVKRLQDACVLVATYGKIVAGFAIASDILVEGHTVIMSLAVHCEFRRCGIGTQLLETLQATAVLDQRPLIAMAALGDSRRMDFLQSVGFRVYQPKGDGLVLTWGK